jgi:cholestenol delta-isomerase
MMSSQASSHPYYPLDAHIKEYAPNETSIQRLLTTSSIATFVILGGTLTWVSFLRPRLSKADRFAILWFVLCKIPASWPTHI